MAISLSWSSQHSTSKQPFVPSLCYQNRSRKGEIWSYLGEEWSCQDKQIVDAKGNAPAKVWPFQGHLLILVLLYSWAYQLDNHFAIPFSRYLFGGMVQLGDCATVLVNVYCCMMIIVKPWWLLYDCWEYFMLSISLDACYGYFLNFLAYEVRMLSSFLVGKQFIVMAYFRNISFVFRRSVKFWVWLAGK